MYDLNTLNHLHLRANGAVPIHCLTAVFTRAGVQAGYPGGVAGLRKRYPAIRETNRLLTLSCMSGGELREHLDAIAADGLDLATCCAVADAFLGPLETCPAIAFLKTGDDRLGGWMARLNAPD